MAGDKPEEERGIRLNGQVGGVRNEREIDGKKISGISIGIDQGYLWDLMHSDWNCRREGFTEEENILLTHYVRSQMAAFQIPFDLIKILLKTPYTKHGGDNGELNCTLNFESIEKENAIEEAWAAHQNYRDAMKKVNALYEIEYEESFEHQMALSVRKKKDARRAARSLISLYYRLHGFTEDCYEEQEEWSLDDHIEELCEDLKREDFQEWYRHTLRDLFSNLDLEDEIMMEKVSEKIAEIKTEHESDIDSDGRKRE